jgi:hypothetical protein
MPNNKKDFSDKDFNCKNCRAHLATEKLDRQILVVGRLAIFNFASIVCMNCLALNLWQSPNLLRDKNENLLSRYPDKASDLPKPGKVIFERLRKDFGKFEHSQLTIIFVLICLCR